MDSRTATCQHCGDEINGQPLYPTRDLKKDDDGQYLYDEDEGYQFVDDPDGPFCGVDCRRGFDEQ